MEARRPRESIGLGRAHGRQGDRWPDDVELSKAIVRAGAQATWSAAPVDLFFYRDTEKREVDIVIESAAGDVVAIETKAATRATHRDIRGLALLPAKLGARFKTGILVYSGEHTLPLSDRVWALPLAGLWQGAVDDNLPSGARPSSSRADGRSHR